MTEPDLKLTDILAIDRTRMAAERSLMAWVRTALSMITFGFTFYKFMQFLQEQSKEPLARPHAPRNLAIALIGIGTFALDHRLCPAPAIRPHPEPRETHEGLGPGLHRGLPARAGRPAYVRECDRRLRPLRLTEHEYVARPGAPFREPQSPPVR